jgi:hypothetical protein
MIGSHTNADGLLTAKDMLLLRASHKTMRKNSGAQRAAPE